MVGLFENIPKEIRQRQLRMKEAAVAFTFGVDAHQYNDAFARAIQAIRKHREDDCFEDSAGSVSNC
jgi:hypothetical protein